MILVAHLQHLVMLLQKLLHRRLWIVIVNYDVQENNLTG
jgi:hypothetical protein